MLWDATVRFQDAKGTRSLVVMLRTQSCLAQQFGNSQQPSGAAGVIFAMTKNAVDNAELFCRIPCHGSYLHRVFQGAVECLERGEVLSLLFREVCFQLGTRQLTLRQYRKLPVGLRENLGLEIGNRLQDASGRIDEQSICRAPSALKKTYKTAKSIFNAEQPTKRDDRKLCKTVWPKHSYQIYIPLVQEPTIPFGGRIVSLLRDQCTASLRHNMCPVTLRMH